MFCSPSWPSLTNAAIYTSLSFSLSLSLAFTLLISVHSLTESDLPLISPPLSSLPLISSISSSSLISPSPSSPSSSPSSPTTTVTTTATISVPSLLSTFDELIVDPGKSVSLKCEATGSPMPTITWKQDGLPIINNERFRLADFVVTSPQRRLISYVNISSISVPDGGFYTCVAANRVASASHSARIHVKGDPYVKPIKDIHVTLGSTVIVNCPYSGYPIDSIFWSKGPTRLPSNRRQEIFSNGSLVIHDVQKSVDDGSYTCQASNGIKTSAQKINIIITAGPMIDPFKFPESIQEGMRARLVCTVIQGDPPFVFQWFKNDELIESPINNIGIRTDEFSSDLTFARVSPRHNGNYTCIVSNSVASDSHTALLNVDVPPYWKVEPVDVSVVSGQNIMIDCLAEGSPQPIITWERGSTLPRTFTTIASGSHFEVYANGSLLIKTVEPDDGGLYLCQASNSIGPGLSKVVTLTVHTHPQFVTKFRSETVRLSDDIELSCDARGDSPMTIEWLHDKQPLEKDVRFTIRNQTWPKRLVSSLRIESARRRDSALFTCLVSNSYGKDETNIRLIVQEPPESPKDLRVLEQRSREAKLTWSQSFNGNSEINRFWITCHPKDYSSGEFSSFGHLNMSVDNLSIEEGPIYIVRDLRPATTYVCSVKSENDVGLSKSSNTVEFKTEEQAPEGPPLNLKAKPNDSRSVKVTWNPPARKLWNGKLKGYYIGYKISGSDEQYLYKTLEIVKEDERLNEVTLSSLKPFTSYDIIVQVYNSMGTGPRSDPITVTTFEDVPSKEPNSVSCSIISSESISVTWESPPISTINGVLLGYKVIYRPLGGDVSRMKKETTIENEIVLKNLLKHTNYSIEVVPYTRKGEGIASRVTYCRTADDVPGPPAAIKVIISSADSVIVTWKDPIDRNGVITKYAVYWRELNNNRTKSSVTVPKSRTLALLSSRYRWPEPSPQYKITSLKGFSAYEIWVTAFTRKGEGESTPRVTQIPIENVPARILEWNETFIINGAEVTPIVLGCHSVGAEPFQRTWSRDNEENLNIEADGSLLIQEIPEESSNYTCYVSNEFGNDFVVYHLDRESVSATDKNLKVQVISTSHTSAQISFYRESITNVDSTRDFELNYRIIGWNVHDWQIKPIFRVPPGNHTVLLDNLLCGTLYKLFMTDLTTGAKSDTLTFQTQGSAPIAPKKEDIIKVVGNSSIYIYPSVWDQTLGCPITKMLIEYRSSTHHTWKMVSTPSLPNPEPIHIPNLTPKSTYSIRITAQTRGSPSTMAEYDVRLGLEDKELFTLGSSFQRGLIVDTTTLISFLSSLVVLVTGCFAIACLIIYRRHTTLSGKPRASHYRRQSSTSCAPSSNEGDGTSDKRSSALRSDQTSTDLLIKKNQSLASIQSSKESSVIASKKVPALKSMRSNASNNSISAGANSNISGSGTGLSGAGGVLGASSVNNSSGKLDPSRGPPYPSKSPIRGRLPQVRIPTKQLEEIEKDLSNEYDEITPYATFRLTGDDDGNPEEEFKTFSVHIGEPGYMYKANVDAAPTTSRDYKTCGSSKSRDYLFGVMPAQSVTSGSSAQDELLYAYEYGRRYQLNHPGVMYYDDEEDQDDTLDDTPTDPGIRQFTKSPPKPNEKRQAACLTPGLGSSDSSDGTGGEGEDVSSDSCSSADSSCVTPINPVHLMHAYRDSNFRPSSFNQLPDKFDKKVSTPTAEEQGSFKIGLSSDEDELPVVKRVNKRQQLSSVASASSTPVVGSTSTPQAPVLPRHRSSGRPHRIRNKRQLRSKSKSDEIEC
ncbi:Down syndrome cell adhesion molecule-like protein Dscam2 isoform X2 [Tetranychus urticae]|uniref:Down syndrome cell adhesion molecule-like protein Dscam2 isoform X2 n=1 Tax=Tetranychus urticae TaxID=32264 RepID=UPI00077B91E8|nr:Down syndrome cell adhesion molecule-like protein Dscam2 isoform X2 [Tetranychus urticae]